MLNRLRGIFNFDQLIWDSYTQTGPFGTYHVADVHLKVGDGYAAKGQSRKGKYTALGYALREIAEQMIDGR